MSDNSSKKILIVPLDWGLGHTTRCIPIIKELQVLGHQVHIGGTTITNALLKKEFPNLSYHLFPSYGITYPKNGKDFLRHIITQLPRLAGVIAREKKLCQRLMLEQRYDVIISDNRFGVRAFGSKNIFISHQLNLSVPQSPWAERLANWINKRYINRFDAVAVPDNKQHLLSGILSNTKGIRPSITFLGNLSRWERIDLDSELQGILVILSGPEPQRTMLEDMIIRQAVNIETPISVVRARLDDIPFPSHEKIKFYNHLSANALQALVNKSQYIISRAGYSTVMDLMAVHRNGILIPTPGQTEQEYLAAHLKAMNLFTFYNQEQFDLVEAIKEFNKKEWGDFPLSNQNLRNILIDLIA